MYIVAWGCCWYICFPNFSLRSKQVCVQESVLHLAVDLGEPGKKTWGVNQTTGPFGKDSWACCGGQARCGQLRHIWILPSPWCWQKVPYFPGRVLLSPAMRPFVLHQTMLTRAQRARMEALVLENLQGLPSRWTWMEWGWGGTHLACCCRWKSSVDVDSKSRLSVHKGGGKRFYLGHLL